MASSDDEARHQTDQQPRSANSLRSSPVVISGQYDDPTETVDRSIDKLENLVRDLRMASDTFSSERLHREKDREELCTKLAEAEAEARRNSDRVDDLTQQLQDTERAVKDKDTLCSTLVHEVDRLRKLLMQLGVDPHKDNEDLSFEEAVSITENHQKRYENTPRSQPSNSHLSQGTPLSLVSHTTACSSSLADSLSSVVSRADLILGLGEGESAPALHLAEEDREQRRLHDLASRNLQKALEVNKKWKVDYNQLKEDKDRTVERLENEVRLLQQEMVAANRKRGDTTEERSSDLPKRSGSHQRRNPQDRLHQAVNEKSKQSSRNRTENAVSSNESEKARSERMELRHEVEYLRRELHEARRRLNHMNSGIQNLVFDPEGDEREDTCKRPSDRKIRESDLPTPSQHQLDERTVHHEAMENCRQAAILAELELPSDVTLDED